jgi:hypothetical protein
MIVCESIQYVNEISMEVGMACSRIDIFAQLDQIVTPQAMGGLLIAQWSVYSVILTYAWVRYSIKMAKF